MYEACPRPNSLSYPTRRSSDLQDITDELGGVEITLTQPLQAHGQTIAAGTHTLTGEQALAYTRQRHGLSGGDFSRVQRQQRSEERRVGKESGARRVACDERQEKGKM